MLLHILSIITGHKNSRNLSIDNFEIGGKEKIYIKARKITVRKDYEHVGFLSSINKNV